MIGGAMKKITNNMRVDSYEIIVLALVAILLKVLLVQWSYNRIWPRLMENVGRPVQDFRPLTFHESLLVVILVTFLF